MYIYCMTTKVINSADFRKHLAPTLDEVSKSKQPILIRRHRQINAALIDVELLEDLLLLHDKKHAASIRQARKEVAEGKIYSLEDALERLSVAD